MSKQEIRNMIWKRLRDENVARFPFPIKGRIPNFEGANQAAKQALDHDVFDGVHRIKINPDSPQRPLRTGALEKGMTVFVPTPRLRDGFRKLDPDELRMDDFSRATTLKGISAHGTNVSIDSLDAIELVVCGSVAVNKQGGRIGKGEGYSDIEYAILKEVGLRDCPVVTTVHPLQIVNPFPVDKHDVPMDYIFTPEEHIKTDSPHEKPDGLDRSLLTGEDLDEMPVLQQFMD